MANDPLSLDEPHEWAGVWWLPAYPDDRVPGVLRYEREKELTLTLIGAFEDRQMSTLESGLVAVHEDSLDWSVIHGAADQLAITLLDCFPNGTHRKFGGQVQSPDKQTVVALTALVGVHADGNHDPLFCATEVSVEDLGTWAARSPFENGFIGAPGGRMDGSGSISAKPMEESSVDFDSTVYTLAHRRFAPSFDHRRGGTTGHIRDTTYVRIAPAAPCSLQDAISAARSIQDLVSLATHRAAGVNWLRLRLAGEERMPRVEVLYSPAVIGEAAGKAIDSRRVFFTCDDLAFEEVLPRWCEVRERLLPAMNLVLGLRYAPKQYLESRLLMATGAAEALHRRLGIDALQMPKSEFKAMRNAMLELAPEDQRERLQNAIRNDMTLRDRLRALATRPDQEAIAALVPDVERWAGRTVNARNDLAHEGDTPRHSIEELVAVVDVTAAVVILNLLQELGLPAERQQKIVREHPQLSMTARKARETLTTPPSD